MLHGLTSMTFEISTDLSRQGGADNSLRREGICEGDCPIGEFIVLVSNQVMAVQLSYKHSQAFSELFPSFSLYLDIVFFGMK